MRVIKVRREKVKAPKKQRAMAIRFSNKGLLSFNRPLVDSLELDDLGAIGVVFYEKDDRIYFRECDVIKDDKSSVLTINGYSRKHNGEPSYKQFYGKSILLCRYVTSNLTGSDITKSKEKGVSLVVKISEKETIHRNVYEITKEIEVD